MDQIVGHIISSLSPDIFIANNYVHVIHTEQISVVTSFLDRRKTGINNRNMK